MTPGADAFDPTVSGRTALRAILSNLLVRTLVGYNHVAGAAGNVIVPDLATRARADERRPDVHVQAQAWHRSGRRSTARSRRSTCATPFERRAVRERPVVATSSTSSAVSTPTAPASAVDRRHLDAERQDDQVHAHPAGRRLPAPPRAAGGGADPARGRRCFEGGPRSTARSRLVGPVHDRGRRRSGIGSCAALRPMRGISRAQLMLVRNPRYDPRTDSPAARESNPDRFVFVPVGITPQPPRRSGSGGELEDATSRPARRPGRSSSSTRTRRRQARRARINPADWVHYITLNLTSRRSTTCTCAGR